MVRNQKKGAVHYLIRLLSEWTRKEGKLCQNRRTHATTHFRIRSLNIICCLYSVLFRLKLLGNVADFTTVAYKKIRVTWMYLLQTRRVHTNPPFVDEKKSEGVLVNYRKLKLTWISLNLFSSFEKCSRVKSTRKICNSKNFPCL